MSEKTRAYFWSSEVDGDYRRVMAHDHRESAQRLASEVGVVGVATEITENRYPDLLTAILSEPEVFGYTETQINDRILNEINRQEYEQAMRQEAEVRGFISEIIETARKCQRNHD